MRIGARFSHGVCLGIGACLVSLLLLLTLATTASAAPLAEHEPNDNILQLDGPVGPDGVKGTLATVNDVDWYLVQFAAQRQVTLKVTAVSCPNADIYLRLRDAEGSTVWYPSLEGSETAELKWTTPLAPTSLYLTVEGSDTGGSCYYVFSATPGDALIVTPPALITLVPVGEPNDLPAQAAGPLSGGIGYTGAIETSNDEDWLYAYLAPRRSVTAELLSQDCDDIRAQLYTEVDSEGGTEMGASVDLEDGYSVDTVTFETESVATPYFIELSGDQGCHWRFRLLPTDGVTGPPPPPPPPTPPAPPASSPAPKPSKETKGRGKKRGPNRELLNVGRIPKDNLHHFLEHGVKLKLRCDRHCEVTTRLSIVRWTSGRKHAVHWGTWTAGSAVKTLRAAQRTRVVVGLNRRAQRQLRNADEVRYQVRVTARDRAGHGQTVRRVGWVY